MDKPQFEYNDYNKWSKQLALNYSVEELQKQTDVAKTQITKTEKSSSKTEKIMLGSMKKNVAENEYRIKNNINE